MAVPAALPRGWSRFFRAFHRNIATRSGTARYRATTPGTLANRCRCATAV